MPTNVYPHSRKFKCPWCSHLKPQILLTLLEVRNFHLPICFMDSPVVRPKFLTILCFLTFMSSISGLWSQSEGLWSPGVVADQMKEKFETVYDQIEQRPSKEEAKMVDDMFQSVISSTNPDTVRKMSLIMIIFDSLTLFAAYLMWNLEKKGFYLYLGAVAFAVIAPIIIIGGMLGIGMAMASGFLSVVMCILYGIHVKHMY